MPVRVLHKLFKGKSTIRPSLQELGGTIITEISDTQQSNYSISIMGILISDRGEALLERLIEYLSLARRLAEDEPLRTHIYSGEVKESLCLDTYELSELGIVLMESPFTSGGSYGSNEWNAGLPSNIEDLPDDLIKFIDHSLMSGYDPSCPIINTERANYLYQKRQGGKSSVFWFIDNDQLRALLESDWAEVREVHKRGAWKATVILSGGIIEGILLDTLVHIEDEARAAYLRIRPSSKRKSIQRWDFFELIEVAKELDLLRGASPYLGHAIRELRNLIHPARSNELNRLVTQRHADLSISLLEALIEDIAESRG
jgi:hypothetical protein